MQVRELAPGLWRWTALHPDWTPDDAGDDGWEQDVGCVYVETPSTVVLIDPLVPGEPESRETFLANLDADVERNGKPVAILLTVYWHERSAAELVERYGASLWLHAGAAGRTEATVTSPFTPGDVLPGGLIALDGHAGFETIYWLPEQHALVAGDALLGDGAGGLRVSPESWLDGTTEAELKVALRALLDLPVELVLPSHGEPVLAGGRDALARALAE